MAWFRSHCLLLLLCLSQLPVIAVCNAQQAPLERVQQVLRDHCYACHGPQVQKAELRLDQLDLLFGEASAETWHDVLNRISLGEMPPEDQPQPDEQQRRLLTSWIRENLQRVIGERQGMTSRAVLRRLTRYEYNNTLQDLLGIRFDFARDLPPESASADGFRNNGATLGISPLQIEYYLQAARLAMDKAIVEGPPPQVYQHRFAQPTTVNQRQESGPVGNRMPPHGRFPATMMEYPESGEFVVRVTAGAVIPAGMGVPRMRLTMGLRSDTLSPAELIGEADVRNSEEDMQVYEFRGRMEEFPLPGKNPKFPGVTITLSNCYDDGLGITQTPRYKAIAFNAKQKQQVQQAILNRSAELPSVDGKTPGQKAASGFLRQAGRLQKLIEELRLLTPQHPNRTDLAYRLFDIQEALQNEQQLVEQFGVQELQTSAEEYWNAYQELNSELLEDRRAVLAAFQDLPVIDRRTKELVPEEEEQVARSTLVVESMEFVGPLYSAWPPESHTRLIPPSAQPEPERARIAIAEFMARAWRRPVSDADVESVLSFYTEIRPASASFEEAMRESLALILIAPEFLYLVEPQVEESRRALTEYELASRLSYFLWSTMPDTELLQLAETGVLGQPQRLRQTVQRMLADSRSEQFVRHFTDQWLDLAGIDRVAVNPEYYPDFNDELKPMLREQTQVFFAEVLRRDLSALSFLDSDFTVLNGPLAKHYGLAELLGSPAGGDFQMVRLPAETGRGGLLTQGSFLLRNSTGEDSHPIRRAVWILDRLLGSPPASPPPDVPELNSERADLAGLPMRRQLEQHRTREACNDCHQGIDPWGIVLESFDAVGQRRETVLRKVGGRRISGPLEDTAVLPGGATVSGVDGLQQHLLRYETDRFAGSLVTKLLTYGLGRTLVLEDGPVVERLVSDFRENGYRLGDLIVAIVQTDVFRSR